MSVNDPTHLTLDQINYQLRAGYAGRSEAERFVAAWNLKRTETTATIMDCRSRDGFRYLQILAVACR